MVDFSQVEVFQHLPGDVVEKLNSHMVELNLEPSQILMNFGDEVNRLFIVDEGSVEVFTQGFEAHITTLGIGSPIGEMTLIDSKEHSSASIRAGEEGAKLLYCSHEDFKNLIFKDEHLSYCFYQGICSLLAHRLRLTNRQARENVDRGVEIIQQILSDYRLTQRIDDVKDQIEGIEGTVFSTLSSAISGIDELINDNPGVDTKALKSIRETVQMVVDEDFRDIFRISKKLNLLMQCLNNVKRATYG